MAQPIKQIINPWNYFSKELTKLIGFINSDIIPLYSTTEITPELFIFSALENVDCMLYKALNSYLNSIDISKIHDEIGNKLIKGGGIIGGKVDFSKQMNAIFNVAFTEKDKTKSEYITSDHILLAILKTPETNNLLNKLFESVGLFYEIMLELSLKVHDVIINDVTKIEDIPLPPGVHKIHITTDNADELISQIFGNKKRKTKSTPKDVEFCTNLNLLALDGEIEELVGRDKEIKKIFRVLARRKSNNVILTGEQGVGKTQCVYGLAKMISDGLVPLQFRNCEIWKLNPAEMIAGTQLRGMFEDRLVDLISELKSRKNAILFIDNIDSIFGDTHSSSTDYDNGGSLTEILSNGDIQVIATTTFKGLKHISNNKGDILKKFQEIVIEKPSIEECVVMLNNTKKYYEDFHHVKYGDDIIRNVIELSNKYITDKSLPSSAIDIIDELGSYKTLNLPESDRVNDINKEINTLTKTKDTLIKDDKIDETTEIDEKLNDLRNNLANILSELKKRKYVNVTMDDVYQVISEHTNIPISKISTTEKETLKHINNILKSKIIGQDEAIDVVCKAIKRNKIGLSNPNKPRLSVFACGPTGCGKTLLAKTLAKEIFGDEKYLVRFDMSEYADETSVNKLIGSAAGYVGYSEGGLLTEAVKKHKYCVLLVDEIEKANDKVYNLLLQVLDEGFLTDNTGERVDFKNTIIVLTSNVGAKRALSDKSIGFVVDDNTNRIEVIKKELKNKFPPEFLNRLDDIVYFNGLTEDNLKSIIKLELSYLKDRVVKIGFDIQYNDDVIECLFKLIQTEKEYGARPIHRVIRDEIENKITDLIIDNDYSTHTFNVTYIDNKIKIE